jgi:hypothetical protein
LRLLLLAFPKARSSSLSDRHLLSHLASLIFQSLIWRDSNSRI